MRRIKRTTALIGRYSIIPVCGAIVLLSWFAVTVIIGYQNTVLLSSLEYQTTRLPPKHENPSNSSSVDGAVAWYNPNFSGSSSWRYSFAGDLSWIRPLRDSGGLASETFEELQERLSRWKQMLGSLMLSDRDDVRIAAWPISGSSTCHMYRTAIRMSRRIFAATALEIIRCVPNPHSYTSTCTVPIAGVKCEVQGEKSRQLIFQLNSDIDYVPYFEVSIFGESFRLLVEVLPVQQGTVHVCTHGVLYPENVFGLTPDEHFELFWAHYARFGVSDVHLYTNSTVYLDVPKRIKQIRGSTLWFHEMPLPTIAIDAEYLKPEELKSQYFAMNECVIRARAMGASMVLIHDLDEFVFPSGSAPKPSIKLKEIMSLELENPKLRSKRGLILWMESYLFNTLLCGESKSGVKPDWYHNFLDHFQAAQLDQSTYKGRRKSMLIFNNVPLSVLLNELWYDVHDAQIGTYIQERSANYVHLHHYRESWHKNVCSQDFDPTRHVPWQRHHYPKNVV